MFVSSYPYNLSLGEVEMKIFQKFLNNEPLTESEEFRADQMKNTVDAVLNKKKPHRFVNLQSHEASISIT